MDPTIRAAVNRVVVQADLAEQSWRLLTDVTTAYQDVAAATLDAMRALVEAIAAADAAGRQSPPNAG